MNLQDAKYNIGHRVKINGACNSDELKDALLSVVKKQEVLRTRIVDVEGEPQQFISNSFDFSVSIASVILRSISVSFCKII